MWYSHAKDGRENHPFSLFCDGGVMQYEEKRRNYRVGVALPVSYQVRGEQKFGHTLTRNLSASGVSFLADDFIKPNTHLALDINILKKSISMLGTVRWSSALPHVDKYQVGLEFMEVAPQDRNFISDYILMRMREQAIERSN